MSVRDQFPQYLDGYEPHPALEEVEPVTPESVVTVTSYRVSCLPFGHPDFRHYALAVTHRIRGTEEGFIVTDGEVYFDRDGRMTDVAVLMPVDEAIAVAKRIVPGIVVGDRRVVDVLAEVTP